MSHKVYLSPSNQAHNLGVDGVTEKDRMHRLAKDVGAILEQRGITVIYGHPNRSLSEVVKDSNALKPDLHIALHSNAGGGTGVETWTYGFGTASAKFGAKLQAALVGALGLRDRGIKDATQPGYRWAEVVNVTATSVLTEVFFHDNANDIQTYNHRYLDVVNAVADAIADWFGVAKPDQIMIQAGGQRFPAVIIEDRSYAQVRQLAEALGHVVEWSEETKTVIIR